MSLPFHVTCSEPAVGLFQLDDGRFQLIQPGPIVPLMVGRGYVLIELALVGYLRELNVPRLTFEPAVIWQRGINQEYRTHARVLIEQFFASDQINDLDLDGDRLLTLDDQYLFASPSLRQRLLESQVTYLQFSEGLSMFATNDG